MDNHEEAREFTDGSSVLPSNVCLCLSVFIYPPLHSGPSRGLSSKDPSPLFEPMRCARKRFTCRNKSRLLRGTVYVSRTSMVYGLPIGLPTLFSFLHRIDLQILA